MYVHDVEFLCAQYSSQMAQRAEAERDSGYGVSGDEWDASAKFDEVEVAEVWCGSLPCARCEHGDIVPSTR